MFLEKQEDFRKNFDKKKQGTSPRRGWPVLYYRPCKLKFYHTVFRPLIGELFVVWLPKKAGAF